ncbi:hypothetical protein LY76DRAFT_646800 [Colletotrichum caudatum]|nr:hypothetical protein LY76DRAFT_646800 [Colletotrichum caudatum]
MSRRMACKVRAHRAPYFGTTPTERTRKVCRERKVRCDGEAECGNCRRSGDHCVYLPTNKSTKADITQSLEAIQERLERAEALIEIQNQALRRNTAPGRPYSAHDAELQGMSHADFYFPAPAQVAAADPAPKHRGPAFPRYQSPENAEADLFGSLPTPRTASRNDMYQFQMYDLMPGQMHDAVPAVFPRPQNTAAAATAVTAPAQARAKMHAQTPGHRDVPSAASVASEPDRATASPSSIGPSPTQALLSPSPPPVGDAAAARAADGDGRRVLGELKTFSADVFATQAQIAAVAAATADLMTWLRQAPLVSSGGVGGGTSYGGQMVRETLATLEERVRELQGLAETGHKEAWARLRGRLGGAGPADVELRAHEGELQGQLAAISDFFRNEYNVSSPLREQDGGAYAPSRWLRRPDAE